MYLFSTLPRCRLRGNDIGRASLLRLARSFPTLCSTDPGLLLQALSLSPLDPTWEQLLTIPSPDLYCAVWRSQLVKCYHWPPFYGRRKFQFAWFASRRPSAGLGGGHVKRIRSRPDKRPLSPCLSPKHLPANHVRAARYRPQAQGGLRDRETGGCNSVHG